MKVCLHLTLTNVVFELPLRLTTQQTQVNLTLTNVVFECIYWSFIIYPISYLTLTNVVFEFIPDVVDNCTIPI